VHRSLQRFAPAQQWPGDLIDALLSDLATVLPHLIKSDNHVTHVIMRIQGTPEQSLPHVVTDGNLLHSDTRVILVASDTQYIPMQHI
jgi:hypothetical protein